MVDVALNWPGVSSQRECLSPMMKPNISIPFRLVFITQFLRECVSPMKSVPKQNRIDFASTVVQTSNKRHNSFETKGHYLQDVIFS